MMFFWRTLIRPHTGVFGNNGPLPEFKDFTTSQNTQCGDLFCATQKLDRHHLVDRASISLSVDLQVDMLFPDKVGFNVPSIGPIHVISPREAQINSIA